MRLKEQLYLRWQQLVFGKDQKRITAKIMSLRILEEAVELCQAHGWDGTAIEAVCDQVLIKPKGKPKQEFGGVMVTAIGYAAVSGIVADEAYWAEYERILDPKIMTQVRERNLNGDKLGLKEHAQ
jgi:hypothetical protein